MLTFWVQMKVDLIDHDRVAFSRVFGPGSWFFEGSLDYVVPDAPERNRRLEPGVIGVIRPTEAHRVELLGKVRFKVEFLRREDAD